MSTDQAKNPSIAEQQNQIVQELSSLEGWEDRYRKIIAWGKALPSLPEELKTEGAKVKGCQSQVWLHAHLDEKGRVLFQADSDALIVRGLVALLLKVYSQQKPEEILKHPPHFIQELGFEQNLSPSRANGLRAMIHQMRLFAQAFLLMGKS